MGEAKTKLEIKKKMFDNNPDMFIHSDELIIGVIRKSDGFGVKMNPNNRADLEFAYAQIAGDYPFARQHALRVEDEKNKSNIVIPDKV